jgi:glycopeptide antibiotics resistance protein
MRRRIALWLIVIAIAAVTIPWDWQDHSHWNKVAWVPFRTGIVRPIDLLINVTLYFPLGFLLPSNSTRSRFATALVAGLMLSTLMELTQVWSHVRFPSATDSVMNVLGSLIGAFGASWREAQQSPSQGRGSPDPDVMSA